MLHCDSKHVGTRKNVTDSNSAGLKFGSCCFIGHGFCHSSAFVSGSSSMHGPFSETKKQSIRIWQRLPNALLWHLPGKIIIVTSLELWLREFSRYSLISGSWNPIIYPYPCHVSPSSRYCDPHFAARESISHCRRGGKQDVLPGPRCQWWQWKKCNGMSCNLCMMLMMYHVYCIYI